MSKLTSEILDTLVEDVAESKTETTNESPPVKAEEKPPEKKETVIAETEKDSGGGTKTSTEADKGEATPPATVAVKEEEKKAPPPASFKVKVDGEESEVDQEELIRGYQLARTSHKRFQEASQYKKDADRIIESLDKDPIQTAFHRLESKYNGDTERAEKELYRMCLNYVEPFVLAKQMSEEERETFEDKRRLEREKSKIESERARLRQEKETQAIKTAEEKFDRELRQAISKHKISTDPKVLRVLANYIRSEYLEPGLEFEAEDAVYAFSRELKKREEEWKAVVQPTTPAPMTVTSTAQPTTPKPFPSTKSNGEAPPAKERERKPATSFRNSRDFHRALLEELS
jgi:hypothetical protein